MKSRYTRSPVRLVTTMDPVFLEWASEETDAAERAHLLRSAKKSAWQADDRLKMAVFRLRRDPSIYCILHPSTKEAGRWQMSKFDAEGPWGDVVRSTAAQAMKDGLDGWGRSAWKLETVVDTNGRVYGKPL